MSHQHKFGRANRGRHTGVWVRTCLVPECGFQQLSTEQPREEPVPATEARTEQPPTLDIRGRMERLSSKHKARIMERFTVKDESR